VQLYEPALGCQSLTGKPKAYLLEDTSVAETPKSITQLTNILSKILQPEKWFFFSFCLLSSYCCTVAFATVLTIYQIHHS
jgi:hypothetical protein